MAFFRTQLDRAANAWPTLLSLVTRTEETNIVFRRQADRCFARLTDTAAMTDWMHYTAVMAAKWFCFDRYYCAARAMLNYNKRADNLVLGRNKTKFLHETVRA